jgi:hypothetical protein
MPHEILPLFGFTSTSAYQIHSASRTREHISTFRYSTNSTGDFPHGAEDILFRRGSSNQINRSYHFGSIAMNQHSFTLKNLRLMIAFVMILCSVFVEVSFGGHGNSNNLKKKIGVLLVNHGSRSETWRKSLFNLEDSVRNPIARNSNIHGIKTAFMEYTEPSIATRLREFDADGFTDVIIVPVFLTISPHSFDDIPTIIGQKEDPQSVETLKMEKIQRYTPNAKTHLTPLLDFTDMLKKNVLRRVRSLSKVPSEEGLVMIAYGDETYKNEWIRLLRSVGQFTKRHTGISEYAYGWCGHLVHYNPDSTTAAVRTVLEKKKKAIVIPLLVAHDEMFQVKIIGDGIANVPDNKSRVKYKPDSILPDKNIENWVVQITNEFTRHILTTQ